MKKAILSPLSSAFVIPGLGQVLNQHLKKGLAMLLMVFIFLVLFIVTLYLKVVSVIKDGGVDTGDPMVILDKIMMEDPYLLYGIFFGFIILWAYSVVDAFIGGLKQDRLNPGGLP